MRFLDEVAPLGDALAILLVQLPPSLAFDREVARRFFDTLCERTALQIVCEPRHVTWFEDAADALLDRLRVSRVAADPAKVAAAAAPGGWRGLAYYRLHGSPVVYRSSYDDGRLEAYAAAVERERSEGRPTWCIFDNTASSAATGDALKLQALTSR